MDGYHQVHRTRTVRQTLTPEWHEHVEFWAGAVGVGADQRARHCGGFVATGASLCIKVYDDDGGGNRKLRGSPTYALCVFSCRLSP